MSLNQAPFRLTGRPTVLIAEGRFSTFGAKTAVCYLRYRAGDVTAVVDSTQAGRTAEQVLGFGGGIPVIAGVAEASDAQVAIVGTAPRGGRLDAALRRHVLAAANAGLDIVSGLHDFLGDDVEITTAAERSGSRLWDVRRVPPGGTVGTGSGCRTGAKCVLLVGSDCNVGKMTAALEMYNEAKRRGVNAAWAATGQTGMMLRGRGVAVDRVIADFIAGATEELVNEEGRGTDVVFVEGQGSLVHPGFAGVTLGLMHGAMPDAMVMVHAASRMTIGDSDFPMPPLRELIDLYESILAPLKKARVVAVAMNTAGLEADVAYDMIERAHANTGLPTCDPVRDGAGLLVDAVLSRLT